MKDDTVSSLTRAVHKDTQINQIRTGMTQILAVQVDWNIMKLKSQVDGMQVMESQGVTRPRLGSDSDWTPQLILIG